MERHRKFFEDCPLQFSSALLNGLLEAGKKMTKPVRIELSNGITAKDFEAIPKLYAKKKEGLTSRIWIAFSATWANSRKGADLFLPHSRS